MPFRGQRAAIPLPRTLSGPGRALHRQATLFRRQHVGHSRPTHKHTRTLVIEREGKRITVEPKVTRFP
jgi:hypothetical protein